MKLDDGKEKGPENILGFGSKVFIIEVRKVSVRQIVGFGTQRKTPVIELPNGPSSLLSINNFILNACNRQLTEVELG